MNAQELPLQVRLADEGDVPLLGRLNRQLIEDEGHASTADADALADRMRLWLAGDYSAALVTRGSEVAEDVVAYALWRSGEDDLGQIYLRQFFVARGHRRGGVGRRAYAQLEARYWTGQSVALDALTSNERGLAFWRDMGFAEYSIGMCRRPSS